MKVKRRQKLLGLRRCVRAPVRLLQTDEIEYRDGSRRNRPEGRERFDIGKLTTARKAQCAQRKRDHDTLSGSAEPTAQVGCLGTCGRRLGAASEQGKARARGAHLVRRSVRREPEAMEDPGDADPRGANITETVEILH